VILLGYFDRRGNYRDFDWERERKIVPEKKEVKIVEPKEEDGVVDLFNNDTGVGFIKCDAELVGFSLDSQWREPQEGIIFPQKNDKVKFIRKIGTISPRADKWWYVPEPVPKDPAGQKKIAAIITPRDSNTKIRIMRRVPGGSAEIADEGTLWEINGRLGHRPSKKQDPINDLRRPVNGKQPEVWFEELIADVWRRCDDPRPPFKEDRRRDRRRR